MLDKLKDQLEMNPRIEQILLLLLRGLLLLSIIGTILAANSIWTSSSLINKSTRHISQLKMFMEAGDAFMNWFDLIERKHSLCLTAKDESTLSELAGLQTESQSKFAKLRNASAGLHPQFIRDVELNIQMVGQELRAMKELQAALQGQGSDKGIYLIQKFGSRETEAKVRKTMSRIRHAQIEDFETCRQELDSLSATTSTFSLLLSAMSICSVVLSLLLLAYSRRTREDAASSHRLAALVKSSQDAILSTDKAMKIASWNPASERLFGYDAAEVIGKDLGLLLGQNGNFELKRDFELLNNKTDLEPYETVWFEKSGNPLHVSVSVSRLGNKTQIGGAMFVARNIETQVQLQNQRREFIAALTHDLKNPIIGNTTILRLLLEDPQALNEKLRHEILEKAISSNERMLQMIASLLDVYKLEYFGSSPNLRQIDLRADLLKMAEELKMYCIKTNQEIALDLSCDLLVETDNTLVVRILTNLIDNAARNCKEGTKILLSSKIQGQKLLLEVSDNGPGIPEDYRKNLFNELRNQVGTDTRSHGIGLYLSRKLSHLLGGELYLKDSDKGCSFVLSLPRKL